MNDSIPTLAERVPYGMAERHPSLVLGTSQFTSQPLLPVVTEGSDPALGSETKLGTIHG